MTESADLNILRVNNFAEIISLLKLGAASNNTATLTFYNSSSTLGTSFQSGNATAALTYVWPTAGPVANNYLLGSSTTGTLSWINAAGTYAPIGSTFVTISSDATLTNERVLTGTANQVVVTDNGANSTVVLSLPQSIATGSSVTFNGITATSLSSTSITGSTITANGQLIGKGTSTNDSAAAGFIGEYTESLISSQTSVGTNNQYFDATSLSLTAGDWDVTGNIEYDVNSATFTTTMDLELAITTTTGNSAVGMVAGSNLNYLILPSTSISAGSSFFLTIPAYRVSLASTTTHYLKGFAGNYTAGTPKYRCRLSARRVR